MTAPKPKPRWALVSILLGTLLSGCQGEAEAWWARREAARREAEDGRFEALLAGIWAEGEHPYNAQFLDVLGRFAREPTVDAELVAIYRMHPDPRLALAARVARRDFDRPMDVDKIPRPRLFLAEACVSLGLRWLETSDPEHTVRWARCVTPDGYDVDPVTASHLLWQRHRGDLSVPISGATLPYPREAHLQPTSFPGSSLPVRYRTSPQDVDGPRQPDLWRADLASWVRAGPDGETRVPGPPPTPFTVPPEPTGRAWERVGVPPAPEFP